MKNALNKVVGFEFVCIFVPATSSCNQLVSDNNSCLDNPVGQASFLWLVAAWCRCLPIGLFIYLQIQRQNAHRNHAAEPAATHPTQKETASHSYPDKGRKANCIHAAARRINPQTPGANTATVMLTTDIPPAAFLHTTLNNRLAA